MVCVNVLNIIDVLFELFLNTKKKIFFFMSQTILFWNLLLKTIWLQIIGNEKKILTLIKIMIGVSEIN